MERAAGSGRNRLANPLNAKANELKDRIVSIRDAAVRDVQAHQGDSDEEANTRSQILITAAGKVKAARNSLDALKTTALDQGRSPKRIDQAIATAEAARKELMELSGF